MFKIHRGICSCGCGKEGIVCVRAGYIEQCNHRIKKEKKNASPRMKPVPIDDPKQKTKVFKELKNKYQLKRTPLKRTALKKKFPKKTGEKELFLEIWNERPHYCTNTNCKEYLGEEPLTHYFAHLKSKGAHGELRLNKDNITLLCFDCHYIYDNGDRTKIILDLK